MGSNFQVISQCAILLLAIFIAIATDQIQGRPLNSPSSVGFGESDSGSKDDFRPTTPGNSPGVGHHAVKRSGTAPPSPPEITTEQSKDDFRPTMPGHSPGIGHAIPKIASKPKA